jgi:hypothetical protein
LAEAYAWLQNDEALMNAGRTLLSGRVGEIVGILQAVEEDAPGIARASTGSCSMMARSPAGILA